MDIINHAHNNDVDVDSKTIRNLKKDVLALVACDNGETWSYGTFTINYSLIKLDSNLVKNSVIQQMSQLGTISDTDQFKEDLLSNLSSLIEDSYPLQASDIQSYAQILTRIIEDDSRVNVNSQEFVADILDVLSASLTSIDFTLENITALNDTATLMVEASSHLLGAFDRDKQTDIADVLVSTVDAVYVFLLANKTPDQEPVTITSKNLILYANRLSSENLTKVPLSVPNSDARFKLPNLGSEILPADEPVDVKMTNFIIDPWNKGQPISSIVAGLSLASSNGSAIPVANLTEEIEIFLPRTNSAVDSSDLDLRNFSTTVINVTTANITLVMMLNPNEDLTLMLLLGYQRQPTEQNHLATVTLPQQGNSKDEKYTWVLGPDDITIDVGVYNLVIVPVVSPGVKSVNATVTVTAVMAQCIFWEENRANWSDYGCRVGPKTTANTTHCLCTHLTFFGSSFFVMPNTVDPSKSAQLFSNFAKNPVVVCFIGAIFVTYILMAVWARRKDLQDKAKVRLIFLLMLKYQF
ncbi:hypothetical protein DNTS_000686 [Danionella cerebrum]|uniref:GAIN-B domain-containing protein n=1 Tax=Danionella cerebrum TaxID=2873325 RepID=A0A553PZT6_9TELE|nr:hypothetical protein DNTS_000686 [Danionella translucida]